MWGLELDRGRTAVGETGRGQIVTSIAAVKLSWGGEAMRMATSAGRLRGVWGRRSVGSKRTSSGEAVMWARVVELRRMEKRVLRMWLWTAVLGNLQSK